jgi:transcriptional regulator GlxA family with amidase domain
MHKIGLVVYPEINVMNLAMIAVFELANTVAEKAVYDIHSLSESGGLVPTSLGMTIGTEAFGQTAFDTLLFAAATLPEATTLTPALLEFVREASRTSRRVGAPCTGAFVLAEAGILDGRRATTHWFFARDLKTRYPNVKVDEDRIFVVDGPVWTSAGMSAGIDLALAMVEEDLGVQVARSVARKMVVYHRRAGGQSQFSALLELEPKSDRIQSTLAYARGHLHTRLSIEELADVAHLSPRQFSRAFRSETGQSPARAIENLRVEAARLMLEEGQHSIDVVARETGFGDRERMRRAFLRAFGQPPQVIRRNVRIAA